MSNLFIENQTQFELITTTDGSPSICLTSDIFRPEAMHHREGALSESLFIYHGLLDEALKHHCPPRILSVGLGCAYNELITIAHFLANSPQQLESFYLESFEGDDTLRNTFINWLAGAALNTQLEKQLANIFQKVLDLVSRHFNISPDKLKKATLTLYESKQFVIRDWLKSDTQFHNKFGVIYFDAFSNKSTPELWSDEFLNSFLSKTADSNCGLATYAATGALNRALKQNGFQLREQKGFAAKRQSTRALRLC
jgi:tRNA U34 5-methylaminomethyl-2-thiouridine-forming methyltransferase MnmC